MWIREELSQEYHNCRISYAQCSDCFVDCRRALPHFTADMKSSVRPAWCLAVAVLSLTGLHAQDLLPRAYVITPVRSNAVILTWSYFDGGPQLQRYGAHNTGAKGSYSVPIFSYYYSFKFLGRSANIAGSLPYGAGTFSGSVLGTQAQVYRSGLLDSGFRLSVNLKGGPAMQTQEFVKWKQKTLLGASLRVVAPTGQYDPQNLINWGINRWALKPEFGYSQRWNKWVLDGCTRECGFISTNNAPYSVLAPATQTLQPIGAFEGHLSRDFEKQRLWVSLDGNFWFGGTASLNGVQNPATKQTSSRIGSTASLPMNKHQAIKLSYSAGSYARFGGNYQNVSIAWQYLWLGGP